MRILVIRFSSLGDVVLASAPLCALAAAHPAAEILMATKREYAPLFDNFPAWLTVIPYDPTQSVAAYRDSLGAGSYDLIVDLHGSLRSRLVTSRMKFKEKRRVDKQNVHRWRMVWSKKGLDEPISVVESYLKATGAPGNFLPQLFLSENEKSSVAEQTRNSQNLIGIGWGAKHPTKTVPFDLWSRLIHEISEHTSVQVEIFGLRSDEPAIKQFIHDELTDLQVISVEPIIGLPLRETMTRISACRAFLTSDSGLMHVADALGVPTFGLFGPTHPALGFTPAGIKSQAFHAGTWCSPCHRHGSAPCFRERRFCFDELNVHAIAAAVASPLQDSDHVPQSQ